MSHINWNLNKKDLPHVEAIVARAVALYAELYPEGPELDPTTMLMDIIACHLNGCPLRLAELAEADEFNFSHDVWGIRRHMDRKTGKLTDCFLPRYWDSKAAKAGDV